MKLRLPFTSTSKFEEVSTQLELLKEFISKIPKDSVPQDLREQSQGYSTALKGNTLDHLSSYHVAAAYSAVYGKIADTRKKQLLDIEKIRQFYMVDVIITQMTEDSLTPEIGTGRILKASSEREDLQREIDYLNERFEFDKLAQAVTPDLLCYGEYIMRTEVKPTPNVVKQADKIDKEETLEAADNAKVFNYDTYKRIDSPATGEEPSKVIPTSKYSKVKSLGFSDGPQIEIDEEYGLINLEDDVDQGTVVSLTKYSDTVCYLHMDERSNQIHKYDPAAFVKFSLSSQRLRIDLLKEYDMISSKMPELEDIPRFIRVGRSLIHPVIAKLKELELLESLVPATKLSKLSNGSLVGVQVPSGYDINKAIEATKQIEGLINKRIGVDQKIGQITVENILSTSGRMKVVPIFGEKGQLSKLDYKSDEPDDLLTSVNDIRRTILTSVGVPYELIYESPDGKKGEMLKKYARYLRKLKAVQKAIEDGVRQIIYIHLANKGYKFVYEDVKIEFYNKLIEIDNLDKLEFVDTTVGLLKNLKDFVFELADQSQAYNMKINVGSFLKFADSQFKVVGLDGLVENAEGTAYAETPDDNKASDEQPDQFMTTQDTSGGEPEGAVSGVGVPDTGFTAINTNPDANRVI